MTKIIEIPGRNGGRLRPQQPGQPAPAGAGRKPNPFKQYIQDLAGEDLTVILKGRLLGADGNPTGDLVEVAVELPGAMAVVMKAYNQAKKGDANARKWLTETGWGKTLNLGDADNPLGGGFAIILPSNDRK